MFRLLNTYDWKWCLVILGAICSTNCLFGLMFKPLPKSEDDDSIGCEKLGDSNSETLLKTEATEESLKETMLDMWSLMKDWAFMMFAISNFLTSLGYPIPYSFVPVSTTLIMIIIMIILKLRTIVSSSACYQLRAVTSSG